MQGKTSLCLLIILQIFNGLYSQPHQPTEKVSLTFFTGSKEGLYYQVGQEIKRICEQQIPGLEINVIPSAGSLENLERLKDGLADWAIIQRDIAVDAYYNKNNPFHDFEVILPLFAESVQLFITPVDTFKAGTLIPIRKFIQLILKGKIHKFAIGPPGSGSNTTIKNILSLYGIDAKHPVYQEVPYDKAFLELKNHNYQGVGWVRGQLLPEKIRDINAELASQLIPITMRDYDYQLIISHIPNLENTVLTFPSNYRDTLKTVQTLAFFVTRKEANRRLYSVLPPDMSIVQIILSHYLSNKTKNLAALYTVFGPNGIFRVENTGSTLRLYYRIKINMSPFRGLPLHSHLKEALGKSSLQKWYVFTGLIILFLFIITIVFNQLNKRAQLFQKHFLLLSGELLSTFWKQHKRPILAALIAFVMVFPLTMLLRYYEYKFYLRNLIKSPLLDFSFYELMRWLFLFALTGFEQGIFPQSIGGQIIVIITSFLGWSAIVLAIIFEVFSFQRKKLRRQGMERSKLKNHIVVCGCNDRLPKLLLKAINAEKKYLSKKHRRKYLVLDTKFREYVEKYESISKLIESGELEYINGDPKNAEALKKANIDKAFAVILLAEDRSQEADERTMLRALSISRYCRMQNGQSTLDSIYIIAEVNDPQYADDLYQSDVNEVICSSDMIEDVILQSSLNHGISEILSELLQFNEFNEFYYINIEEYPFFTNKTYNELLLMLREHNILLLGIKIVFKENGKEIIDLTEIANRLKQRHLTRQIIVNPLTEAENNYRTQKTDHLIVLAQKKKQILKEIKQIKRENHIGVSG